MNDDNYYELNGDTKKKHNYTNKPDEQFFSEKESNVNPKVNWKPCKGSNFVDVEQNSVDLLCFSFSANNNVQSANYGLCRARNLLLK